MITGTSKNCSIVRKWINVRSVVYAEQQDCRKFSGFRLIKHELVQTLLQALLWTFQYFNFFWASSLLSIDRLIFLLLIWEEAFSFFQTINKTILACW